MPRLHRNKAPTQNEDKEPHGAWHGSVFWQQRCLAFAVGREGNKGRPPKATGTWLLLKRRHPPLRSFPTAASWVGSTWNRQPECRILTQDPAHRSREEGRNELLEWKCWTCRCTKFSSANLGRFQGSWRKETGKPGRRLGAKPGLQTNRWESFERGWQRGEIRCDTEGHSSFHKCLLSINCVPGTVLGALGGNQNPLVLAPRCSHPVVVQENRGRELIGGYGAWPVSEKEIWAGSA